MLDTRELMSGKDGSIFVEVGSVNVEMAEVESFAVNININTVEKHPVGDPTIKRVPVSVTYDLTISAMMIRDDLMMAPLLEELAKGHIPTYNFQTKVTKPDGQEQRVAMNNVVPNGAFTLVNVTPGEVLGREYSFAINEPPKFITSLAATYLNK